MDNIRKILLRIMSPIRKNVVIAPGNISSKDIPYWVVLVDFIWKLGHNIIFITGKKTIPTEITRDIKYFKILMDEPEEVNHAIAEGADLLIAVDPRFLEGKSKFCAPFLVTDIKEFCLQDTLDNIKKHLGDSDD